MKNQTLTDEQIKGMAQIEWKKNKELQIEFENKYEVFEAFFIADKKGQVRMVRTPGKGGIHV